MNEVHKGITADDRGNLELAKEAPLPVNAEALQKLLDAASEVKQAADDIGDETPETVVLQ